MLLQAVAGAATEGYTLAASQTLAAALAASPLLAAPLSEAVAAEGAAAPNDAQAAAWAQVGWQLGARLGTYTATCKSALGLRLCGSERHSLSGGSYPCPAWCVRLQATAAAVTRGAGDAAAAAIYAALASGGPFAGEYAAALSSTTPSMELCSAFSAAQVRAGCSSTPCRRRRGEEVECLHTR